MKWWLLAIPHYLVLGLLLGGTWQVTTRWFDHEPARGVGLIQLLVLVAGVILLFTGRYPRDLHDLVVGLDRWVLRVAAYACLMTDQYPPFRLDLGGTEAAPGAPTASAPAPPAAAPRGWGVGRVVAVVLACLALATSLEIGRAHV